MSKSLKQRKGVVVSISGNKTVKVAVKTRKRHSFYKKIINKTWTALVHDEASEARIGDVVNFVLCRPISLKKRWRLTKVSGSK